MDYIIRKYDSSTGSILVEFTGYGTWNIDLPINNGMYPEGEELEAYIQGFAPIHIAERKAALQVGIQNEQYIKDKVQALLPTSLAPVGTDDAALAVKIKALITQVMEENKVI